MSTLAGLEQHPHAAAVLGAALRADGMPSHAYLLSGPAGSGKRAAARTFAAELLAAGVSDPDSARLRAQHGAHPDLTWVTPSGAHEMRREDIDEAVVGAAAHTPFESTKRVFVLERVDTLNDAAANTLLKTLEEPAAYVVLLLLTDKPGQVLPTIASRCQHVRFDARPETAVAADLEATGISPATALACARLSLGDGERARALAHGEGPALRAAAEAFARASITGTSARTRPWAKLLAVAATRAAAAREELERARVEELDFLPDKQRKKETTKAPKEFDDRAKRAERRAGTAALDHALQLIGLWFRDLGCIAAGAPELAHNADRLEALAADADGRDARQLRAAVEFADDTRARLALNVSEELALEALAYRIERVTAS